MRSNFVHEEHYRECIYVIVPRATQFVARKQSVEADIIIV